VTRTTGLLNPNHYLSVAIDYLFGGEAGGEAMPASGRPW